MTLHDVINKMADEVYTHCPQPYTDRSIALCLLEQGYVAKQFDWCIDEIIERARELSEGQERAA